MSKYIWLLDAGHGGMKDGKYTTAPGKMFIHQPNGPTFYEGVNNRIIIKNLADLLRKEGVDYAMVYDEVLDTSLYARTKKANAIHAKNPRCIYLSVHSDAMPEESHGQARGAAVYTSPGLTPSDYVADIFVRNYQQNLKSLKFRPGGIGAGNLDKEEKFYVLVHTRCPSLLTENGFYDHREEAMYLQSAKGQKEIPETLFLSIRETEKLKPV